LQIQSIFQAGFNIPILGDAGPGGNKVAVIHRLKMSLKNRGFCRFLGAVELTFGRSFASPNQPHVSEKNGAAERGFFDVAD